jgi:capsular polysaccharide biosynthesis protein
MSIKKTHQIGPFKWSRTLPQNLVPSDKWLFTNAIDISCDEISITIGENILVDTIQGIAINKFSEIVEESLVVPKYFSSYQSIKFIGKSWVKFLKDRTYLSSHPCLLIHDAACTNYGHWMTDAVSRLYYARDLIGSHQIILPAIYHKQKYRLESLIPFGVKEENIVYVDSPVTLVKDFAMPSFMGPCFVNPKDEIAREIREIYHQFYNLSRPKQGTRLYISRAGASYRKVVNESQVIDLLLGKGFTVVYPEQLSFEEQVRSFAAAEIVVGLTGAAFNNMMFMHSGCPVVEFRLENDNHNLHYFSYASAHELPYYYLSCKGDTTDRTFANFFVDLHSLDTTVEMALACDR